jgi:hypothetical protein
LLPAIVRKVTKEDKIHIIDDATAKLDLKLRKKFDWTSPSELSEHMLKNMYATNTIKQ